MIYYNKLVFTWGSLVPRENVLRCYQDSIPTSKQCDINASNEQFFIVHMYFYEIFCVFVFLKFIHQSLNASQTSSPKLQLDQQVEFVLMCRHTQSSILDIYLQLA